MVLGLILSVSYKNWGSEMIYSVYTKIVEVFYFACAINTWKISPPPSDVRMREDTSSSSCCGRLLMWSVGKSVFLQIKENAH